MGVLLLCRDRVSGKIEGSYETDFPYNETKSFRNEPLLLLRIGGEYYLHPMVAVAEPERPGRAGIPVTAIRRNHRCSVHPFRAGTVRECRYGDRNAENSCSPLF